MKPFNLENYFIVKCYLWLYNIIIHIHIQYNWGWRMGRAGWGIFFKILIWIYCFQHRNNEYIYITCVECILSKKRKYLLLTLQSFLNLNLYLQTKLIYHGGFELSLNFQNYSSVTPLATNFIKIIKGRAMRIVTEKMSSFISNPVLRLIIYRKNRTFSASHA